MRAIKNITLRVSDDFHYSVKTLATRRGITLQKYMIDVIERDLVENSAYVTSPETITELFNELSAGELAELIKRVKEESKNKK